MIDKVEYKVVFEFDQLIAESEPALPSDSGDVHEVPKAVFTWLEARCFGTDGESATWLRPSRWNHRPAVKVMNFVGVIRAPDGFQIEVLPKVGRRGMTADRARALLLRMLVDLGGFRHLVTEQAHLHAVRMPLMEVFIAAFLDTIARLLRAGLRAAYVVQEGDLPVLRGKLHIATQLRRNLFRKERFAVQYDEFSTDRAENRLLHSALRVASTLARTRENQKLARELQFAFADIPYSVDVSRDELAIRRERGMAHYAAALDWALLILRQQSPVVGSGDHAAPSLLFPMEAVFEAYVAACLRRQLKPDWLLEAQVTEAHLVCQGSVEWFGMRPDLLVTNTQGWPSLVLDTKWKLLDTSATGDMKNQGLSQSDFYQLLAYGDGYLHARDASEIGDLVLIYPKTQLFERALEPFTFNYGARHRLWVTPFCLETGRLLLHEKMARSSPLEDLPADRSVECAGAPMCAERAA